MRYVRQTIFNNKNGNCFQACIASMLGLSLSEVPNFAECGDEWWASFRRWALGMMYSPLEINWPIGKGAHGQHVFPNSGQVCWAVGKSPRGDWLHAILVVWANDCWELLHDPHPDNMGLDGEPELIGMLVPLQVQGKKGERR